MTEENKKNKTKDQKEKTTDNADKKKSNEVISDAKLQLLFQNAKQIISSPGEEMEASQDQRQFAVFFRSGILAVESSNRWNPHVMTFREVIRRSGFQIREEVLVELSAIRTLYEEKKKKDEESGGANAHTGINEPTPMQKEVLRLFAKACSLKASDIHIIVGFHEANVRMRIDGDLVDMYQIPSSVAHELLAASYNMADSADASYRLYEYQAARISMRKAPLPPGLQGVRLQFNPLEAGGRYFIGRLLYAEDKSQKIDVDKLGFHPVHLHAFDSMRARPEGVNFISGPTGSGKSTTLKVALEATYRERQRKINILTIEDPPEYTIEGAAQMPVTNVDTEEERGAAYRKAISAALRSDPDVIMPGEARDKEVINLVFTAAMTGHQVWTSIHANSAMAVFDRVKDQGVQEYKLYDPDLIVGLLAQRLLRLLCPHCKIPLIKAVSDKSNDFVIKKSLLKSISMVGAEQIKSICVSSKNGCSKCNQGRSGRTVVAEIITPDAQFMEFMIKKEKSNAIRYWETNLNGISMKEHAILKMIEGVVDPRDLEDKLGPLSLVEKHRIPEILALNEKFS